MAGVAPKGLGSICEPVASMRLPDEFGLSLLDSGSK